MKYRSYRSWIAVTGVLAFVLSVACGTPEKTKGGGSTEGQPNWNPPPVGADCPIDPATGQKDADKDGACDVNEVANGTSPSTPNSGPGGGEDGLNMHSGNGKGDNLSPIMYPIFAILGSMFFNAIVNNDCEVDGFKVKCVDWDPENVDMNFTMDSSGSNGGMMKIVAKNVTISQGWFLAFNLGWWAGGDLTGTVEFRYRVSSRSPFPLDAVSICTPANLYACIPNPTVGDPALPKQQLVTTTIEAGGCEDGSFTGQNATGIRFVPASASTGKPLCFEELNNASGKLPIQPDTQFVIDIGYTGTTPDSMDLFDNPANPTQHIIIPRKWKRVGSASDAADPLVGNWKVAPAAP